MSFPAADLLKGLVAKLEATGKANMQHLKPEYIQQEQDRLVRYAEEMDTARQLERYGVPYVNPDI
jgi:hypothetical protein